ncbi:MAG TPA: HAD-IIIC family phosphatase [Bryobacteraceae bacterium]
MATLSGALAALDREPSLAGYSAAARQLKHLGADLPAFRVAILANHTFAIETVLAVECARRGLGAVFYQAGYDQYRQELLEGRAGLDAFAPDAVLVSLDLESAFPGISTRCGASDAWPATAEWIAALRAALDAFRARSAAPAFLLDFIPPPAGTAAPLDAGSARSLLDWTVELNAALRGMACALDAVYVIGAAGLAAASGFTDWRDARMWYLARAGINPKKFPLLASHIARCFAASRRPAAKCLVLDLDNTLWGGILGDAGPEGILCADTDYPANAYADFQRAALALRSRGILLAVASKNDQALVEEAFRQRAGMPLRHEHISAWEVHWEPKPESLRRIAARLNIALDSLVFLDDNPDEIDLVRRTLPEVRAYQMPDRPERFAAFLARLEDFDQLRISEEDLRRAGMYEIRRKQSEIAAAATDLESFYRSLETVVTPEPASPANLERISQLIAKTNQFNLTTRRHDRAALSARLREGAELWAFRASDVHGDHGIVAVALLDFASGACRIDTLILSCRVIGRTIETAILHFLEERAVSRGHAAIHGEYRPTAKNGPCRDLYAQHGFVRAAVQDDGTLWTKDLRNGRTCCPEWITLRGEPAGICAKS